MRSTLLYLLSAWYAGRQAKKEVKCQVWQQQQASTASTVSSDAQHSTAKPPKQVDPAS